MLFFYFERMWGELGSRSGLQSICRNVVLPVAAHELAPCLAISPATDNNGV